MAKTKVVISLSGGLDSTILTYTLVEQYGAENVHALSFNYNQKHSIELEKAKTTCMKLGILHKVIDITFLGDMLKDTSALIADSEINTPTITESLGEPQPVSYVSNRNLILSSLCASYAESIEAKYIYLAFQQQDVYGYWDTTLEFVKRLNQVLQLNRKTSIEIKAPFVQMSKSEEIEIGLTLNVPFEDTWTCYSGSNEKEEACGTCLSCSDRIGNFAKLGIKDTIKYIVDIDWDDLFTKHKTN